MNKQELREQQPIAYQTLQHALRSQSYAHAYLFHGPLGTPKKEMAVLFAQSILCSHTKDGFACETCERCRRIAAFAYADLYYIDGSETSVKKQEIVKLQELCNKTALEQDAHKIYIIDRIENATAEAVNALLKFLEEPDGEIIAILLSDQLDSVLPTIVSRCQCIPFHPLNQQACYALGKKHCDPFDAYVLSRLHCAPQKMQTVSESEDYQHARYVFLELMPRFFRDASDAVLFLQTQGYPAKNKKLGKESFRWLLEMLIVFWKDCTKHAISCEDARYVELWNDCPLSQEQVLASLQIVLQCKDILRRPMNLQLLADQMMYELKEVRT